MTASAIACPRCGSVNASGRLSVCPRCLLEAPADRSTLPTLGAEGLVLEAELGHGGMGRVFRARDVRLGLGFDRGGEGLVARVLETVAQGAPE